MEIQLAVFVSDKVPEIVIGDQGRFRQIITNLVGNSVKVSGLFEFYYLVQPTQCISIPVNLLWFFFINLAT